MIPRIKLKWRGTASAANITAGLKGGIAMVTFAAGADAASLLLYDALTATGTPIVSLSSAALTTPQWGDGSVVLEYRTGLSTTISGTAPVMSIYEFE